MPDTIMLEIVKLETIGMESNKDNSLGRPYQPKLHNFPNIPNDMVIAIDKEKLPEDVRRMIDEVLSLGQSEPSCSHHEKDREARPLFALQTGTVIGNIYDKNFKLDNR